MNRILFLFFCSSLVCCSSLLSVQLGVENKSGYPLKVAFRYNIKLPSGKEVELVKDSIEVGANEYKFWNKDSASEVDNTFLRFVSINGQELSAFSLRDFGRGIGWYIEVHEGEDRLHVNTAKFIDHYYTHEGTVPGRSRSYTGSRKFFQQLTNDPEPRSCPDPRRMTQAITFLALPKK